MFDLWIDIANTPRVLFFNSLLDGLKKYSTFITTTPEGNTYELMKEFGMSGEIVGGINVLDLKEINTIGMYLKLIYKVPDFKVSITLEGARPIITSKIRKKPIVNFLDNDLKFKNPSTLQKMETRLKKLSDFFIVPKCSYENFSDYLDNSKILKYEGYKEHISMLNFNPNDNFLSNLPFEEYIVLRPESFKSFYVKKNDSLIPDFFRKFSRENINIVYLPRGEEDQKLANNFENVYVPPKPLNGLDLSYHARATLTGSGTMAREAAVLGTPAVSFFPGDRLLAVDQDLVDRGKMLHSRDPREIVDYVLNNWENKDQPEYERARKIKKEILEIINDKIAEIETKK